MRIRRTVILGRVRAAALLAVAVAAIGAGLAGCSSDSDETAANFQDVVVPMWEPADAPALLIELNSRIGELTSLSTALSPVLIVDQFTGFDAIDDTTDGVHPTPEGESKIAANWADALAPLLSTRSTQTPPTRVLLLGDSITDNHYRAELWHGLYAAGYHFDFLGTQHSYPLRVDIEHLEYEGVAFDSDHQGHTGWQTKELLHGSEWDPDGNLASWLDEFAPDVPDIATLHIGTNDLIVGVSSPADIVESITEIVGQLRMANPQVTVLIAQIIPYLPWDDGPDTSS